jgi:uncharacterized membrane protein
VVVGIENNEHESVAYAVVMTLQRTKSVDGEDRIVESRKLDQFRAELADNEAWRQSRDVTPTMAGDGLRLAFLLYPGDLPSNPTLENAYRTTYLRVNVTTDG